MQVAVLSDSDLSAMLSEAATRAAHEAVRLRPRPSQVDYTQAAEMLGQTRQTVSKKVKAGAIKLNNDGKIPITEIDRILSARHAGC